LQTGKATTKQSGKGLKSCFCLELQRHTPSKAVKVKKLFRLELAKAHTKQRHKGKSIALAKLQVKRQRIKKLFRLKLKSHHQAKAQRKFIALKPNKAVKD